jgi:hypothetical protein
MSALHNPVRTMKCLINKTISGFAKHSRIVTESAVSSKCNHHLRGDFSSHMRSPQRCTLLDMTAFPRSGRLVVKTVRFTITARVSIELAIMLFYHTVHTQSRSDLRAPRSLVSLWQTGVHCEQLCSSMYYIWAELIWQAVTVKRLSLWLWQAVVHCKYLHVNFLLLTGNCSYFRALRNSIKQRGNFDKNKERK